MPTADEPFRQWTPGVATGAELDRRLSHDLCVWCTVELGEKAYHDLYCSQDCQMRWMQARNGEPGYARPVQEIQPEQDPAIEAGGPPAGLGLPQTSPDADAMDVMDRREAAGLWRQWSLGQHATDWRGVGAVENDLPGRGRVTALHAALGLFTSLDLPVGWDYAVTPGEATLTGHPRCDLVPPGEALLPVVIGTAQARPSGHRELVVGGTRCPGVPALAESEPPVLPSGPWPVRTIDTMMRQGFVMAVRIAPQHPPVDCPLPVERECPRCGQWAEPVVITGDWPTVAPIHGVDPRAQWSGVVIQSKLCCSACRLPYRGPVLVPMVRRDSERNGGGWTLAVVGEARGERVVATQTMSATVIERVAEPCALAQDLWDRLYRDAVDLALPWVCVLPGCGERVSGWVTLAAAMGWQGWLWDPVDGTPLHLGLCGQHGCELRAEAYRSYDLHTRMQIPDVRARWVLR